MTNKQDNESYEIGTMKGALDTLPPTALLNVAFPFKAKMPKEVVEQYGSNLISDIKSDHPKKDECSSNTDS